MHTPSPGAPGEGRGEGDSRTNDIRSRNHPHPNPYPGLPGKGNKPSRSRLTARWRTLPLVGKIFAIASREYAAAVKTKAFVISVLLLPIMFGLIFAIQSATDHLADDRVRTFAVIDHVGTIYDGLQEAVAAHNLQGSHWSLERAESSSQSDIELSNRVRSGNLAGFLTIDPQQIVLHAVGMGDIGFRTFADQKINETAAKQTIAECGI